MAYRWVADHDVVRSAVSSPGAGLMLAATFAQAETDEGKRSRNAMAHRLLCDVMGEYAEDVLPRM